MFSRNLEKVSSALTIYLEREREREKKNLWMFILKSIGLECVNNILVSSTHNIGIDSLFIILGKSCTRNKNGSGPKMEPCGTPCLISDHLESTVLLHFLLFIDTL